MQWIHNYAVVNDSLAFTSLLVSIPIFFLFWALAVKRMAGHWAGIWTLLITIVDVAIVYNMPVSLALSASALGIVTGLFPISWIIVGAVFLYNLTVHAGQFDIVKGSIASISSDRRMQALLIAFAFGAFLEGAAGFGTPVAISGAILIGLGFNPLYAAGICLVANTAPVAYGAIGGPIIGAAAVTGLDLMTLSQAVGRQLPFVSVFIPFYMIVMMAGWKGAKEVLPAILVCGVSFAVTQYLSSNYLGPYLPDIISSLSSLVATGVFLKFWKPRTIWRFASEGPMSYQEEEQQYSMAEVLKAWSPFILLTVMVGIWGMPSFKKFVATELQWFINIPHWPGLDGLVLRAAPIVPEPAIYAANYRFDYFSAAGTAIMLTAFMTMGIFRISPRQGLSVFSETIRQLIRPMTTISAVLGFAYLANYSGLSYTLGLLFASTGPIFPFLSPILGWLGVFLTGSDFSSNALFGKLQQVTAEQIGVNPILTVAANSSGGVMGKMISPSSIAVATASTGLVGKESALFRFTILHSIFLVILMGLMTLVQAYIVPEMIPINPVP